MGCQVDDRVWWASFRIASLEPQKAQTLAQQTDRGSARVAGVQRLERVTKRPQNPRGGWLAINLAKCTPNRYDEPEWFACERTAKIEEPRLIEIRRNIHAHPETSFEEIRTSATVARELARLGIEHRTGIGRTGVVGTIEGARPGPTLLIRADMDALPIQEQTGLPYARQSKTSVDDVEPILNEMNRNSLLFLRKTTSEHSRLRQPYSHSIV